MTTRASRFQADIDPKTFLFVSGQIYDEVLAVDPVTDVLTGTGRLLPPVTITKDSHPALFDALNAQAVKCDERLAAARAEYLKQVEPAPVVRS